MSIKRRLTFRLITWLLIVGLVLLALAISTLLWTVNQLSRIETGRQFESAGLYQLVRTVESKGNSLQFDEELIDLIRKSGGWLQRIDNNGVVTDAFFTPADVPLSYGPGELMAYTFGMSPFPYHLYLWIQEKDGILHTLIYGFKSHDNSLLEEITIKGTRNGDSILLPLEIQDDLRRSHAWLQIIDQKGTELASFNKPEKAISNFTVQDMALRSFYPDRYGTRLVSQYDKDSSLTWVLNTPLPGSEPGSAPRLDPENRVLIIGIGSFLLGAIILFGIVSYWLGQRFGSPIVHILKWLRFLGEGRYEEPVDARGIVRSQNRRGKRKRKYRVYQDVIDSMNSLSQTLHHNERLRDETEKMRNEWIAGVSHDLKTPLSSIKGYAYLLDNDSYEWTTGEIRSFARIILDKSSHLDDLIDDLALTYRLRNGHGAPSSELVDLNEYTAEAILEATNHPVFKESSVKYIPAKSPIYMILYKPWFQRIVDNLVANALMHNGEDTTLTISIEEKEPNTIILTLKDDGKGMDEETVARLFERYYRGTDTESRTEGSGLGMAITKALVEALGGSIQVITSVGQGTTLIIKWPSVVRSD
ncbi:sensor histidine kinase [Cohnella abietis]|uniref:histidine kinase n=1 Tax=Cohnella abietis TaxID=2507935 RepID=A0A3T1D1B2_9BACL|nr:HAMP domain-containing sensor histidine kinase [Cohnella abietis]BBI31848.1 two-component sensor histidine kinase [Cohnella abietis]